jgi:hypothetical protein
MERNENLAKEAVEYIELAQKFENENDYENAIHNYQLAADCLKRSGYLMERVDDIYAIIENLKSGKKKEQVYQYQQVKAQINQLQEQAFSLVEIAQKLENENRIEESINQYKAAIKIFLQAGWTDIQLQNLRDKIVELSKRSNQVIPIQRITNQEEIAPESPAEPSDVQIVDAFGTKKSTEKAEELKKFRDTKKREEQIQNDAFAFIDNAKFFEKDKNYDKAIESYQKAIELLNQIGWQEQTKNFQYVIQKLQGQKYRSERLEQQRQLKKNQIYEKTEKQKEGKLERLKVIEQGEAKIKEERIQNEAFNLIDIGKKYDREKQYKKALESFQKAIELLKSIEWDAYVQPIINFIDDIKEKQEKEKKLDVIAKKRESELRNLQDSIFVRQREEFVQTAREIERRRQEYEKEKRETKQKEDIFFSKLGEADAVLKEGKDLETAVIKYQDALEHLKNLGSGWEPYIDTLNSTILSIRKLKEDQTIWLLKYQKKTDQYKMADLEFQEYISKELDKERTKIKQRALDLEVRRDELEYREQKKNVAFKALEEAQDFINQKDYDNAILAYQSAGSIFAGIQWEDEIHLIENAINELEERKRREIDLKQNELKKAIERQKADMQFQEQIASKLKEEREKLHQSEILLREREQELDYREKQKEKAFKILDSTQDELQKGDYDKTIELYQNAMNIFAEIQWYDEVELIGKSILEIRNRKREAELKTQRDLQMMLKKEQEDNEFHQKIVNEMKIQKQKLQQKQLILRDREKELELRAQRKEEAFRIIDEAQNYLSLGEFDMSIDSYRKVAEIFSQIQWDDELNLIMQAIRDIEIKKKENELWKEKSIQEAMEREIAYQRFLDQIKHQREIEKIKIEREKELLQQKKKFTEANVIRQDKVLNEIENADILINQERYNEAIEIYEKGLIEMQDLGWTESYLKLLEETLQSIIIRKNEKETELERQKAILQQKTEEEKRFYRKIEQQMSREQKRLEQKAIEIQEKEVLKERMKERRAEAFELMDNAEIFLSRSEYDQAIDAYRQAEQVLSQIRFPTDSIREMILKIQEKKREKSIEQHKELERKLLKEKEEVQFRTQIAEKIRLDEQKIRTKQIQIQQQALRKIELDEAKKEAFTFLEEAENLTNLGNYEAALDLYHNAELKLSEIQFPTDVIKEMKVKIQNKIREREISNQKDLENALQREKEEKDYQQHMNELITQEKQRLKVKDLELKEKAKKKADIETKRDEAFNILDGAKDKLKNKDFGGAIKAYQDAISNFIEIGWENEISLLQTSIREIQLRRRGHQAHLENEKRLQIQKEEEEKQFAEDLTRQLKRERERLNQEQLKLREYEKELKYREDRKNEAFILLDQARTQLDDGNDDKALELYYEVEKIFAEIQWNDEIQIIHNSIIEIQNRRTEAQIAKQREIEENLNREKDELAFQYLLLHLTNVERQNLERQEIELREKEIELQHIEDRRQEAFNQLDRAQKLILEGKLDEAQNYYYNVINIFAEIQWNDEIVLIQQAIRELDNKKREADFLKQKQLEKAISKEKVNAEFLQQIKRLREDETRKIIQEREKLEKVKEFSVQAKQKQEQAFNTIERAETLLSHENFDDALIEYQKAIELLKEIGWSESYLNLLEETTFEISNKKVEKERRIAKEKEIHRKKLEEEKEFEKNLAQQMEIERRRLQQKELKLKQQEELKENLENRKIEAFNLMDRAELLLKQGLYEQAIEIYFQAELILSEIQFPTDAIKEMILKVQERRREYNLMKQQEMEMKLKREQEETLFFQKSSENMRIQEQRMRAKQIKLKKREELKEFFEQRKNDAFDLLDQAELYVKKADYNKALEFYRTAELILNEIQYPTDSVEETILKINEKKKEQDLQKQFELEHQIQKEREEKEFQKKVVESLIKEKERIRKKEIKIEELESLREKAEKKREEAFSILDDAEKFTIKANYDKAIEQYRKAIMILDEIQYPTDSIKSMITKATGLKEQYELERELSLQRQLKKLEEEQQLQKIVEERKRQEREKKAEQQLALQQKERLIQEQMTYREAAYALLEEGGRYLKRKLPEYGKAISLYIQARDLLAEKIGWEPEINNLNQLINDLTKEQEAFLERKQLEEELRIKRQKEYEVFQQEIRSRRLEYEKQQREQKLKFKQLYETQQYNEQKRENGLVLIDDAKQAINFRDFKSAYAKFGEAVNLFNEIGWKDQAKYIKNEIENTKKIEQKILQEEERIKNIHQELEKKKQLEERKKQEEEAKLKEMVSEVGNFTSEISQLITEKKNEEEKKRKKEKEKVKSDAELFKRDMMELLEIKREILNEVNQSKKELSKRAEQLQYEKDKEKVDEIKDMLRKIAKKEKK